jgi:hypothetical protein
MKWKNSFLIAITVFLLFGMAAPVMAHTLPQLDADHNRDTQATADEGKRGEKGHAEAKIWKYADRWKKLNELEQDYLQLKVEMLKRQNQTLDLYAKKSKSKAKDMKKMNADPKYKEKMRSLHNEFMENKKQIAEQRKAVAQALNSGDDTAIKAALDKWIDLKKKQNRLMQKKLNVWDKMLKRMN